MSLIAVVVRGWRGRRRHRIVGVEVVRDVGRGIAFGGKRANPPRRREVELVRDLRGDTPGDRRHRVVREVVPDRVAVERGAEVVVVSPHGHARSREHIEVAVVARGVAVEEVVHHAPLEPPSLPAVRSIA